MQTHAIIQPLILNVPQETIDDLQARLSRTRWPNQAPQSGWEGGADLDYLKELVAYWRDQYDWRAQETVINRFAHYTAEIDGVALHFIHERGTGEHPLPIILTHGFPDSFLRFSKIIPMLTDPASYGGDPSDAFDVVVPSLPGFGFSGQPAKAGMTFKIAGLWSRLMTRELGYARYAAHGGDWGSTVTEQLARDHGDALVGIHLTDVPFHHLFRRPKDPSPAEEKFLKAADKLQQEEAAYALVQSSRPRTLGPALNDSPAGLAAWIVDLFYRWSDCDGQLENCFTKDELLTNVMLYWITGTIQSSFLPYFDTANAGAMTWIAEMIKGWTGSTRVPAAFASFPKDILPAPRAWAERFFNVQRWTEMPRGGHFAALEEPELLVEDLRTFFRPLRESVYPAALVSDLGVIP